MKKIKFAIGTGVLGSGILLELFGIGQGSYLGFGSVGTWLIYVGIISLIMAAIPRKRKVDERMLQNAAKANRVTFIGILVFCFLVMVIDGLRPIDVSYGMFISYFVMGMIGIYAISYKLIDRWSI